MYAHEDEEEETEGGAYRPHKSSRDALLHSIEGADSRWVTCSSYVRSDLPWVVVLIERGVCRLMELARHATDVSAIPVVSRPMLEDWVHPDGRVICIGEAAHPTPVSPSST